MSRNGAGTMILTNGVHSGATTFEQDRDAGTDILSARVDYALQNICDALTQSISTDGQSTVTANIPMSGYKLTNVAIASAATDYARASQAQDSSLIYCGATGGTTTAYTASTGVTFASRVVGQIVRVKWNATSTGAATLNVNGTGAANIVARTGSSCPTGTLVINTYADLMWDGTNWVVVSPETTGWITYAPASGGATYVITTTTLARYKYSFATHCVTDLQISLDGTTSAAPLAVTINTPITAAAAEASKPVFSGFVRDGVGAGYLASGLCFLPTASTIAIYNYSSIVAFTNGVSRSVGITGGSYLCA